MWKQIRDIEFKEINAELEKIRLAKARVDELEDRINAINEDISSENSKQKVSFLKRIFRRREYKQTLMLSSQTISAKREEIRIIEQELDEEKLKIDELRLQELKERFEKFKCATCLEDMNYTAEKAIALLEEESIPVILEENEKVEPNEEKIRDEADIVLIHKTDYMPENDQIQTSKSAVQYKEKVVFGENEYEISYPQGRDTIHFAVNHEVTDHASGTWNNARYAIVVPFSEIANEKIGSACSVDTFIKGNVKLNNNTYILCPEGEGETVRNLNPNVRVVEYVGKTVQDYANLLISSLGYPVKRASSVAWHDKDEQEKYNKMMHDKGLITDLHSGTQEGLTEDEDTEIYKFSAIMKLISEQGIIGKIGVERVLQDIEEQELLSLLTHGIQVEDSITLEDVTRADFLIDTLKEFGINLSDETISQICSVDSEKRGWEKMLCMTVLLGIQSREKTIQELDSQRDKNTSDGRNEEI